MQAPAIHLGAQFITNMPGDMERKNYKKKPGGWYWKKRRQLMQHAGIDIDHNNKTIYAPANKVNVKLAEYAKKYNFVIQLTIE
jgi:hypothetical protein